MVKTQASSASASVACAQAVVMAQQKFTSAQLYGHYSSIIRNTGDSLHVRAHLFEAEMRRR